jgi:hypothetical protein
MTTKWDATNSEHFALFGLNDAQLRRKGLSAEDVAALREAQQGAPVARSAAEVAELSKATARTAQRPTARQSEPKAE